MNEKIKSSELIEYANSLKSKINSMEEALVRASEVITKTTNSFNGVAPVIAQETYESLKRKFDFFEDTMVEYTSFLEKTANEYSKEVQ